MMMPMYMNMIGNQGPKISTGFDGDFAKMFFGQREQEHGRQYGLQMLSLADMFNSRTQAASNNIYVAGNYIGGNFSSNSLEGGYESNPSFLYNNGQTRGFESEMFARENGMRPFSFNFDNSTITSNEDFYRPYARSQRSFAGQQDIETNLNIMNEGGRIFQTPAATRGLLPDQRYI